MRRAIKLDSAEGETPREALQALIRAEIDRRGAIDTARGPLGLIAEMSLRIVEADSSAQYEVINEKGEVRTHGGAEARPFTVEDLVAELRIKHPTLFKPEREPGPSPEEAKPPYRVAPKSKSGAMNGDLKPLTREDALVPPQAPTRNP